MTGIVVLIVPAALLARIPIDVGAAKLPKPSESSAVKMLGAGVFGNAQVPFNVNGMANAAPWQNVVVTNVGALILRALIVMTVTLWVPVITGSEALTLIRYVVLPAVVTGIFATIVPAFAVDDSVPINDPGKTPAALDSSAVYILPALNVPVDVKGTLTFDPAQIVVGVIADVVTV